MKNTPQFRNWISRMRLPAGIAALALAAVLVPPVITSQLVHAQTFTTLHNFDGTDGNAPIAALVQATNGNLYGSTGGGGANDYGTVFKITPSGTLTTLHSFCPDGLCGNGANPHAALIQVANGDFYGTTAAGGVNFGGGANGSGTVFKITPTGTLATLYSFCAQSNCADGDFPEYGALVQATNGDFYGTATDGGANGQGTVFKITPTGTLTTLHSFPSTSTDGGLPYGTLVQAANGDFYGTTINGGDNGSGTVFKITPTGALTVVYSFCSQSDCADGGSPYAGLVLATDGDFYGTTSSGGSVGARAYCFQGGGCGTVFKLTSDGTLTTLYSFCSQSGCSDGGAPYAGLIQATNGNFYGTTPSGGGPSGSCEAPGCGTIFEITPSGTLKTLHVFDFTDGFNAIAALIQDTNGDLYGTTSEGGDNSSCPDCGTVFRLSVGLGSFVKTEPTSGKVGACINILGNNLTGATSVSFDGKAARFKVISSSLIMANVPAGATTGKVEVVTSSGQTLSSNLNFQVTP